MTSDRPVPQLTREATLAQRVEQELAGRFGLSRTVGDPERARAIMDEHTVQASPVLRWSVDHDPA